jgi:dipeptidase D
VSTTHTEPITIESLEPTAVWRFFAAMTAVPRPSKFEDRIQAHTIQTAEELGLPCRKDDAGNILIEVPASPGCESAPIVVLQGHLDMVGEKNADVDHDFENDPIETFIDTDDETGQRIVRARGTTLGADNGIGVAMALAAATDPDCTHGPLEILCTSDEEMGMTGANALTTHFFKGRRMLNLDSEEDDAIYIGCAGGTDVNLTWRLPTTPIDDSATGCRVSVTGLRGGHSGDNIHLNRANAIKALVRVLHDADFDGLRLISISGGSKRNAIPREASAVVCGPATIIDALKKSAQAVQDAIVEAGVDSRCSIRVETADASDQRATSADDSQRVLTALIALPSGVLAVVPEMPGLTQTSNNLSTLQCTTSGDAIEIVAGCLSRSSSADQIQTTVQGLLALADLAGAQGSAGNGYPGWQPNIDSPTLAVCRRVYEELFGETPRVAAIHAGLECGIIGERVGEIDTVSIGPRIEGAHSPDEHVFVESVAKSYRYLKAILAELAKT